MPDAKQVPPLVWIVVLSWNDGERTLDRLSTLPETCPPTCIIS